LDIEQNGKVLTSVTVSGSTVSDTYVWVIWGFAESLMD
jgi:hypothetical protein